MTTNVHMLHRDSVEPRSAQAQPQGRAQAQAQAAAPDAEHRQRHARQRGQQQRIRGRYASAVYSVDSWRPLFRVT